VTLDITRADLEDALAASLLREAGWKEWLTKLFPKHTTHGFAPHHKELWDWVWGIDENYTPDPFVAIWARGGAKSTAAEMACAALGARGKRRYALYICETQDQADDHVGNIGAMMEEQTAYPGLGEKLVNKHGQARGWRRNRLRAANGFTIDALGLDSAARGAKVDEQRPDAMIFDDLDSEGDTVKSTDKKVATITRRIIPAESEAGVAILMIQNLISEDGVFGRMVSGEADYLEEATISGPIPALRDMVSVDNNIISGEPTWEGQDLKRCKALAKKIGMAAFLIECQHDVSAPPGGMFNHIEFRHEDYSPELLASMDRVVCWVDPAVTDTDRSDSQAIQIDGIRGQVIYRLYSWEKRASPQATLRHAIEKAVEYGAQHVGVETDQGGDTWRSVYREAAKSLGLIHPPSFTSDKAGAGYGSKQHRAQQMSVDYERGRIVHVIGTHEVLERALRRFPITKPFDVVDASFWSWNDLRGGGGTILYTTHPTRGGGARSGAFFPMDPEMLDRPEELANHRRELAVARDEEGVRKTRELIEKFL